MRLPGKCLLAALLTGVMLTPAGAYYHFIHYTGRSSPWGPVPEKFDLNALPNKTVTFLVSDNGPAQYPQNDSFSSVLSQIRQAAQAWNGVATSDLRVAFGGLFAPNTPQSSAGGQVVFEDLPPGVLGYGGPSRPDGTSALTTNSNGTFVPITLSLVHLARDLTLQPGPSYSQAFFLTVTHEMGHALGLQHTFTSSTMSTAVTRATSLSRALDADDIAGISVLYPSKGFAAQTGSVTGRITANGQGVHLASVVAIRSGAPAVSTLTNPDGTYRIDGIPPGQYSIYAHALPPSADIISPVDGDGRAVAPGGPFDTTFYPGTKDFSQASALSVTAGAVADAGNLPVRPRTSIPIYDVSLYSYFNQNTIAVKPAYLAMSSSAPGTLVAQGTGIGPGLTAQLLGGGANVYATTPYSANGANYLAIYLRFSLGAPAGTQHLVISQPDFVYVLPSGIEFTQKQPPLISSVSNNGDGTATITASNLATDSQIYFDGLPTATRSVDAANGSATVVPPMGASGQNATVTLFNSDGQNSMFLQSANPPTFSYDLTGAASMALTPTSLPAGSEAMIDIAGVNTRFAPGQTIVGFGSSDVYVRRVFVLSPTHLIADISIAANAALASTEATAITGFQVASQPFGFQILPAAPRLPQTSPVLINAAPGQTGIYPNAIVSVFGVNLVTSGAAPSLTFNDQPAMLLYTSASQINLQIPANLTTGPAVMRLNNGVDNSFPVAVNIDPPPAVITAVQTPHNGTATDSTNPLRPGDLANVILSGFAESGAVIAPGRVRISVGGVDQQAQSVLQASGSNLFVVQFTLAATVPPGSQVPLIVYLDGRSSTQANVPVAKTGGIESE